MTLVCYVCSNIFYDLFRAFADDCALRFPGMLIDTANVAVGSTDVACRPRYVAGDTQTETGWGKGRQEVGTLRACIVGVCLFHS